MREILVPGGPMPPDMELAEAIRRFRCHMAKIQGTADATKVIAEVRGAHTNPDALLDAIRAAGNGDRLAGLAREIQKTLEAARSLAP